MMRPVPRRAPRVLGCLEVAEPLHGWTHTHTHWLEHSGRCPPPPWETSGQQRDVGFRTEWCWDRGWEARDVALHSFPDEVGQLSPHGRPPGITDREETASRGLRPLPLISRCPAPCSLEGGHTDGPQSWEGEEPRGSGRQPGTRAQARLPGVDGYAGRPPQHPSPWEIRPLHLRLACLLPVGICPWALLTSSV